MRRRLVLTNRYRQYGACLFLDPFWDLTWLAEPTTFSKTFLTLKNHIRHTSPLTEARHAEAQLALDRVLDSLGDDQLTELVQQFMKGHPPGRLVDDAMQI